MEPGIWRVNDLKPLQCRAPLMNVELLPPAHASTVQDNIPVTTVLPQELVEAILTEKADAESLKSCALVASNFREPSQRVLFHSLTVDTYQKMSMTSTFLTESPYIGKYIRRFAIRLTQKQSLPLETIALILTQLQKVQHLTIAGSFPSKFAATPLPALPSLRSIEIGTSFFSADRQWMDIISLFLTSANSAPLGDVIVSYRLYHAPLIAVSPSY
ncbi:hypothetical protein B0H11DRAFT_2389379 [Mycena galericulata]|nr:hypothetical protein B0H11DRAFT_2389379 [Mycena galericulata]